MKKSIKLLLVCAPTLLLAGCDVDITGDISDRLTPENEVSETEWRSSIEEACESSDLLKENDSLFDFVVVESTSSKFYDIVGSGESRQIVDTTVSSMDFIEMFDADKTLYSSGLTYTDLVYDSDGDEIITRGYNDIVFDEGNRTYTLDKNKNTYTVVKDSEESAKKIATDSSDKFLEDSVTYFVDLYCDESYSKYYIDSGVYTFTANNGEGTDVFIQFTITNTSLSVLHESTNESQSKGFWSLRHLEITKENVNLAKPDLTNYKLERDIAPYENEVNKESYLQALLASSNYYKGLLSDDTGIFDYQGELVFEFEDYEYTKDGDAKVNEKTERTNSKFSFGYDNDTKCYYYLTREYNPDTDETSASYNSYTFFDNDVVYFYTQGGHGNPSLRSEEGTYQNFLNYLLILDGGFSDITIPFFQFSNIESLETDDFASDIKYYVDTNVVTMICKNESTDQVYQIETNGEVTMKVDVVTVEETDTTYKCHRCDAKFSYEIKDISVTLPDISGLLPQD